MLSQNPVLWLMCKDQQLPRFMWMLTCTLIMVILGVWWNLQGSIQDWVFLPMALFFLVVKVLIAREACRFFVASRKNGALELLLSTPLSEKEILHGHWLALKRSFLWPVVAVIGFFLILMGAEWIRFLIATDGPRGGFLQWGFLLVHSGTAVVDMMAAGWVGMWLGLSSRRPGLAFAQTLLYVVFLPWIVFCLPRILITLPLWFWARGKLHSQLRTVATRLMN